jgi:hypothetical protein
MQTKAVIIDTSTNEIVERPMNSEELAADKAFRDEMAKLAEEKQELENEKLAQRNAILEKLGLSPEEVAILFS